MARVAAAESSNDASLSIVDRVPGTAATLAAPTDHEFH
jgi:hypothetical protein